MGRFNFKQYKILNVILPLKVLPVPKSGSSDPTLAFWRVVDGKFGSSDPTLAFWRVGEGKER